MKSYLDNLNSEVKEYFKILSPEFPQWLLEYIETPAMQRISKISMFCGSNYTKIFNIKYWYSNLDHSIGVALIIWHFTHDKKQTLAGLFHDIATPTFKHCIDFMNGDHETQESTEERTSQIIQNSKEIMNLLKRDNIDFNEVCDYSAYPIADNHSPQLSSDRFEYNFSCGLIQTRVWNLEQIKRCYNDISVLQNEDGIPELGFNNIEICEEYINTISKLWPSWICDEDRVTMQFIADIVKSMYVKGYISIDDLYNLSEQEMINKILNCDDKYISNSFKEFQDATSIYASDTTISNNYCVSIKSKRRYIVPLVKYGEKIYRINDISDKVQKAYDDYFNFKQHKYIGLNFDFKPYKS